MNELLKIFPFIEQTKIDLEKQNKFLNKVTLTGKINALHVAANLFEFTDKTSIVFDELKTELIDALLEENLRKITDELEFKAKTTIDILIRNLFERTADVGFLSTDNLICTFLTTQDIQKEKLLQHLQEYASKYSVYNEIVIFDTEGNAKINMNPDNKILHSNDSILKDALVSDSYVERYTHSDIFDAQEKTLIYAQKISYNNEDIGVLCLCFKFEDELSSIFSNLTVNNESLSISNSKEIFATNSQKNHISYIDKKYTILEHKYIVVSKKTSGYQGYYGIDGWYATALFNSVGLKNPVEALEEESNEQNNEPNLLSEKLQLVIEKANNILEDIADVIINGELIAVKQRVYLLTPILDNLRNISTELFKSIKNSIKNLESVVKEGLINDGKMASHLAIDIMDRNLYERANDSRWWALTPLFQEELASKSVNTQELNSVLNYINDLYTVYTNIFLYDTNKTVVASSNNHHIIGQKLEDSYVSKTLSNQSSQAYFVSSFENTSLYNDKATYIYSASIVHEGKVVGGVSVVFDSLPEFQAILQDSFPAHKKGFMLFVDKNKKVISSTNPSIKVLQTVSIDDKFITSTGKHSVYDFEILQDKQYLIVSVASNGYREYKISDNYKNEVYCLTFIEI
ncbi:cache domain-containing protein [Sulfurimonas sp. SAG-AH-194-C21]|nr:hypothetical protein [Sulfurimonas sp. SAG-AH-194-C21]MDF1883443.1 cache domain-containing protein [Sulfurimonas sp. SAG-AH-194-C21]